MRLALEAIGVLALYIIFVCIREGTTSTKRLLLMSQRYPHFQQISILMSLITIRSMIGLKTFIYFQAILIVESERRNEWKPSLSGYDK